MAAFFQRAAGRPFALGSFDCGLLIADWCVEVTGRDPAMAMRGRYASLDEAMKISGANSLPGVFNKFMRGAGFRLTREPRPGDAAVIKIGNGHMCGAIVTKRGFAVLASGISSVPQARVICAWAIDA